jgi:hypothetical protein
MTTCCNHPLVTPFCPFCGKPNRDPLLEIAQYLRKQSDQYVKQAEARQSGTSDQQKRRAATYAMKAKKFIEWAEHLIEIHKKDSGSPSA